ncbi:MAG: VCBS repeat-containing protein [candidate division Zixibacteria bacterium]|nr:VCBS repeat-containing protein [candidate division Zixibacteria bacterium]
MNTMTRLLAIVLFSLASTLCQADDSTGIVFRKSEQTLGNTRTFGVAIADVDIDGDNDVFMTNYIGPSTLWLNDGNGVFSPSPQSFNIAEVHGVGIGDLNGDTYPDIFLLSHVNPSKVYFNNGAGVFTAGSQDIGVGTDSPGMIVLGDVDGDGDLDAFISYYELPNRLWLNDGKGVFTATSNLYGGANASTMVLADVNGDTYLDLYLSLTDQPDEIWINDGKGNFRNSGQKLGTDKGHESVASGDVDRDGDVDFVVANSTAGVTVWLNQNNTGSFVEAGPGFAVGYASCKLFDADLDGDLDLITGHREGGLKLWSNNGSGVFTELNQNFGSARPAGIACGRLDKDDDLDIVFGVLENSGGNPIYFNESVDLRQNK